MSRTKKSGDLGCALAFSLVAMQPWEHLLTAQMDQFAFLENERCETLLGPFSVSKFSEHQVVYGNARGGRPHLPFCSRCTPAARRSGSPRLMSFSLVPRHSIQRCLHHSSASSSANDHTSSESRNDGEGMLPGPLPRGISESGKPTLRKHTEKALVKKRKKSPQLLPVICRYILRGF